MGLLKYLVPLLVLCDPSWASDLHEDAYNDFLCQLLGGERETRQYYEYGNDKRGYVLVDCETDVFVIEGGFDKRGSLDSLQQAVFFGVVTGKTPVVVIYDTDEKIGKYEHRIRSACNEAGVLYLRLHFQEEEVREGVLTDSP